MPPVSLRPVTDPPPGEPTTEPSSEPTPEPAIDPRADPTPPRRSGQAGPVQYKGSDLEAERGPGLGCFRFQLVVLVVFIILTPLSVAWNWPPAVSAALLFAVILLLLLTGQTIIFLLRLVSADRRGRRRPLASQTKTVGELEDLGAGDREPPAADREPPAGGEPEGNTAGVATASGEPSAGGEPSADGPRSVTPTDPIDDDGVQAPG